MSVPPREGSAFCDWDICELLRSTMEGRSAVKLVSSFICSFCDRADVGRAFPETWSRSRLPLCGCDPTYDTGLLELDRWAGCEGGEATSDCAGMEPKAAEAAGVTGRDMLFATRDKERREAAAARSATECGEDGSLSRHNESTSPTVVHSPCRYEVGDGLPG